MFASPSDQRGLGASKCSPRPPDRCLARRLLQRWSLHSLRPKPPLHCLVWILKRRDGFITRDSATGLDWLDLSLTRNRSHDDIIGKDGTNELGAGGEFAGFRYATAEEVQTLYLHAGIDELNVIQSRSSPPRHRTHWPGRRHRYSGISVH